MADERIRPEAPLGRTIGIDEIVDSIDPDPGFTVVYPTRNAGERDFLEFDPYDWVEE